MSLFSATSSRLSVTELERRITPTIPAYDSFMINGGAPQRSMVRQIDITF